MPRSTRFPAAIHILTLLAIKKGECCSSEWVAKSLGTNAVVVRRIIGLLLDAGFVTSHAGSKGGAMLAVEPDVVLWVYGGRGNPEQLRAQRIRITSDGIEPADQD